MKSQSNKYQLAFNLVSIICQFWNKPTQFDKLYKNKDKFGKIKNNFRFKLSVFYDKYQFVNLLLDAYLKNAFIILIKKSQISIYSNHDFIILFEDFS